MFKEVIVSAAIILGFFLNLFFVEHPNVTSYTITFAISMVVITPFALWWRYRGILAKKAEETEGYEQLSMGSLAVSDALSLVAPITGRGGERTGDADVEKGVKEVVGEEAGEGS
ncbi:hypothetical protein GLAREA_10784 [Glarea lozoyensis ATCC 20868]|uniref:Uncharacterized protein n=1 Tax=Glarea lozoyensis (strain ATCC 20868 / MF5171) TaxID=1116229 RepID=S3E9T1_GLAL2|nr:uncharacterized protein GLAREA_10784 [Glarea lozoyensis ATCC 20868]EPE35088.1 hypothetical protein GLAREA_10784 [Glarea lozoyensis ATCC 20868]